MQRFDHVIIEGEAMWDGARLRNEPTSEMHEAVTVKLSEEHFFAFYPISTLHQKHCLESIIFHHLFTIVRFNSALQRRYVFPWPELVILACDILTSNSRHPRSNPVMSASSQAAKNSITNLPARGTAAVMSM